MLAGGIALWAVINSSAPYASLGDCDDLLGDEVLELAPRAENHPVEQSERFDGEDEEFADWRFEDGQACMATDDPDRPSTEDNAMVQMEVYRHAPETRDDDYAQVSRELKRARDDMHDELGVEFSTDEGTATAEDSSVVAHLWPIETGDGGYAHGIEDPAGDAGYAHESGVWGEASFTNRNLEVFIAYSLNDSYTPEEHQEIAADLAEQVNVQIEETIETE